MMKRFFCYVLILSLVVSIFACSNLNVSSSKSTISELNSDVMEDQKNAYNEVNIEETIDAVTFDSIKTFADYDIWSDAATFESIKFGKYEQDNNAENGKEDIEWIVLKKDGTRLLLLSKYVLDKYEYDDTPAFVEWYDSQLRNWLNVDFYNGAFDDEEKTAIMRNNYNNYTLSVYTIGDNAGHVYEAKSTSDLVSIIGYDELVEYIGKPSDNEKDQFHVRKVVAKATEYAKNITREYRIKLNVSTAKTWYEGCAPYWLRSMYTFDRVGDMTNLAANVESDGVVRFEKTYSSSMGVRPMILIDTSLIPVEKSQYMLKQENISLKPNESEEEEASSSKVEGWEMNFFEPVLEGFKEDFIRDRKDHAAGFTPNSIPAYGSENDGKVIFTYGLRDIDKDDVKELLFFNKGNLFRVYTLANDYYKDYQNFEKMYYPRGIEAVWNWVEKDQTIQCKLYPDNFIVKKVIETNNENAKAYTVYWYETKYLKDDKLEIYDWYDYYTNSADGLGTYYKDSESSKMTKEDADAKYMDHGEPIVLTDGTLIIEP